MVVYYLQLTGMKKTKQNIIHFYTFLNSEWKNTDTAFFYFKLLYLINLNKYNLYIFANNDLCSVNSTLISTCQICLNYKNFKL